MLQTIVSTKYQVVIPKEARKKIKIKPGQRMNVHVAGGQVILSPSQIKTEWKWPEDYLKKLKNPWAGVDSEEYLKKERNSWE